MRFLRFDLLAYGGFTDLSLDLGAEGASMHVIYGANEAGKSTALRALHGLLFGIAHRTSDAYLHKTSNLRIGALLEGEGGARLEVVRRKAQKSTLLGPDGKPLEDGALAPFLAGLSAEAFALGFGLDHAALRRGGEALLKNEGDVGESLFDAGIGGRGIARLSKALEQEAKGIFAPRASTLPLNQAIDGFKKAKARLKAEALVADTYTAQEAEVRELEAELARLEEERRALGTARRRLEARCRLVPLVTEWKELMAQRAGLGDGPFIPAEKVEARKDASAQAREATREAERVEVELTRLEAERGAIAFTEAVLAIPEAEIEQLAERLANHRKAALDLPKRRAELRAIRERMEETAKELGRRSIDEVAVSRPRVELVARLRKLAERRSGLDASLRSARTELARLEARLEVFAGRLAVLPPEGDLSALLAAVTAARRAGDLAARSESARRLIPSHARVLEDALRALAPFRGGRRELEALEALPREVLERHAAIHDALERSGERLADERAKLDAREDELARREDALGGDGELPTEEGLAAARAARDALWAAIRASGDPHDPSGEQLGGAIALADRIADRLRSEAQRVADHARLRGDRRALERERARWSAQRAAHDAEHAAARAAYVADFASLGFEPRSPAEMRVFLAKLEEAKRALAALCRAEDEASTLAAEVDGHVARLAAALGEPCAGATRPIPGDVATSAAVDLPELLVRAERTLEATRAIEAERKQLSEQRRDLDEERAVSLAGLEQRATELEENEAAWAEAVAALGLPASSSSEEASAVLDRLGAFFADLDKARDLERRIAAMEVDSSALDQTSLELARAHIPELTGAALEARVLELVRRSREARSAVVARENLDRQLERRRAELGAARAALDAAALELAAFLAAANAQDLDALLEVEARSARARELDRRLADLAASIAREGEGRPMAAIVEEASAADLEGAREALSSVEERLELAQRKREEAQKRLGVLTATLARERERSAEEAAAEAESHLADVKAHARHYLRVKLAATVLRREVERYRERNQGPILARARVLFPRLTLDRYRDLTTAYDDKGKELLTCLRADGAEVPVEALSDGTRDQLYLALRLATIERQRPPIPLVLDDVLVHFDDARARAALAVLGEVSASAQTLLFTHHARIVELAREVIAEPRLKLHELSAEVSGSSPTSRPV